MNDVEFLPTWYRERLVSRRRIFVAGLFAAAFLVAIGAGMCVRWIVG